MTTDPLFGQVVPSDGTGSENRRGGTGSRFRPPIGGTGEPEPLTEGRNCGGGSVPWTPHGALDAYAHARSLDRLAASPLAELAVIFRCLQCDAPPMALCEGEGPHLPRLETAADARDEWQRLRSPGGNPRRRAWDRRTADRMPSTALYRAAAAREGIDQ